jgi:hypothetical protein
LAAERMRGAFLGLKPAKLCAGEGALEGPLNRSVEKGAPAETMGV